MRSNGNGNGKGNGKPKEAVTVDSLDLLAESVQPGLLGQAAAVTSGGRAPEEVTTVTGIPNIPALDTRALSVAQHTAAKAAFEAMRERRFLPFDQIDEDPARAELDRRLLVDVLGLPVSLCAEHGPIDLLRRKLAREPQIHGGKKSRVVFDEAPDAQGNIVVTERNERRNDR